MSKSRIRVLYNRVSYAAYMLNELISSVRLACIHEKIQLFTITQSVIPCLWSVYYYYIYSTRELGEKEHIMTSNRRH